MKGKYERVTINQHKESTYVFDDAVVELLQSLSGSLITCSQSSVLAQCGTIDLLNHGPAHQLRCNKALQQVSVDRGVDFIGLNIHSLDQVRLLVVERSKHNEQHCVLNRLIMHCHRMDEKSDISANP